MKEEKAKNAKNAKIKRKEGTSFPASAVFGEKAKDFGSEPKEVGKGTATQQTRNAVEYCGYSVRASFVGGNKGGAR